MLQRFCTIWISKKTRVCIIGLLKSLYYTTCSLYTYVLLIKHGVKMGKYWQSYFMRFYSSRSIKTQKRTGQYTCKSILIRTSLVIKGFINIWPKNRTLSCGNNVGNPEQAWLAYLTGSGSQSECWIRFILPAHGFSHIIIGHKTVSRCLWLTINFCVDTKSRNKSFIHIENRTRVVGRECLVHTIPVRSPEYLLRSSVSFGPSPRS